MCANLEHKRFGGSSTFQFHGGEKRVPLEACWDPGKTASHSVGSKLETPGYISGKGTELDRVDLSGLRQQRVVSFSLATTLEFCENAHSL